VPDTLKGIETPIAYLRTIVRNLAINRRRKQRYELEQATIHAPEWIQPLKTPSPEQQAVFSDQIRLLATALQNFIRDLNISPIERIARIPASSRVHPNARPTPSTSIC
jgi:DNA-directed RNA polymerase specialized sigma24 family protein